MAQAQTPWWAWAWPLLAWAMLVLSFSVQGVIVDAAAGAVLIATVFAAVYHAEVVAHRTGEPFGTLVLAVAVTVIEVALIVSIMIAAPAEKAGLARDTVFAAVMIVCNGIVGLSLLWGGARYGEQGFSSSGSECRIGRTGRAHDPHSNSAECRNERTRSAVQHVTARVCRNCLARALRFVHFCPDGAPPRLLPSNRT